MALQQYLTELQPILATLASSDKTLQDASSQLQKIVQSHFAILQRLKAAAQRDKETIQSLIQQLNGAIAAAKDDMDENKRLLRVSNQNLAATLEQSGTDLGKAMQAIISLRTENDSLRELLSNEPGNQPKPIPQTHSSNFFN